MMHPKQLSTVFALPSRERFEHFVKVVADRQKAWGLYHDGWAMAATDDGTRVYPLWPYKEYAEACAVLGWAEYAPKEISLEDLLGVVLPQLKAEGSLLAVLPTPDGKGSTPPIDVVAAALVDELRRY